MLTKCIAWALGAVAVAVCPCLLWKTWSRHEVEKAQPITIVPDPQKRGPPRLASGDYTVGDLMQMISNRSNTKVMTRKAIAETHASIVSTIDAAEEGLLREILCVSGVRLIEELSPNGERSIVDPIRRNGYDGAP